MSDYICTPHKSDTIRKATTEKAWGYFNFNTLLGTRRLRKEAYQEIENIHRRNIGLTTKRMFNVRKVVISYE